MPRSANGTSVTVLDDIVHLIQEEKPSEVAEKIQSIVTRLAVMSEKTNPEDEFLEEAWTRPDLELLSR